MTLIVCCRVNSEAGDDGVAETIHQALKSFSSPRVWSLPLQWRLSRPLGSQRRPTYVHSSSMGTVDRYVFGSKHSGHLDGCPMRALSGFWNGVQMTNYELLLFKIASILIRFGAINTLHIADTIDRSPKLPLAAVPRKAIPSLHFDSAASIPVN